MFRRVQILRITKLHIFLLILSLTFSFVLTSCSGDPGDGYPEEIIILSKRNMTIEGLGSSEPLTATVVGSTVTDPEIVWSSSDPDVAVYEDGVVVAKGYGYCVIRATYNGRTAACTVNVPSPNPDLSLDITSLKFSIIGSTSIVTALDSAGANVSGDVIWSTSNSNVATCKNGSIVAQGYGSCIITAYYKGNSADCAVEVIDPEAPALSLNTNSVNLTVGDSFTLVAVAKNHSAGHIEWRTSNPEVATCDGGIVTAVGNGTCAIVAISSSGETDACLIQVGAYTDPSYTSEMLDISMPKPGDVLRLVNNVTGQTVSKVLITSVSVHAMPYNGDPYLLLVKLSFTAVKIYDAVGPNSTSFASFKVNLVNEYNVICDYKQFTDGHMIVGEEKVFQFDDFGIQLAENTHRDFVVFFNEISES